MNYELVMNLNIITEWLPVLAGIVFWKRLSRLQQSFFWFLFITSVIDLASTILRIEHRYNLFLFNLIYLIEALFLTYFYHHWLIGKRFDRRYLAGAGIYTFYYLLTTSFSPGTTSQNAIGRVIQCLFIVAYSGIVLIRLSSEMEVSFTRSPIFWFASSSLILYSTELIIYCGYTIFQDNNQNMA